MADLNGGGRFIFVGGAARSGTTLVQNMLDSHPDICGAPEFHHLPDIVRLRKKLHNSITNEWIDLICSYADVDQHICSLIEHLLLPLADEHGCRFLSEKTPNNVLIFSELIELFPAARFIYVTRDPRAVVASLLQVGIRAKKAGWKTQNYTHGVLSAISYIGSCLSAGFSSQKIAPERVLGLTYESLVTNPENETQRICKFLTIEWCEKMMRPGSIKHLGEKAVTNDVWYDTMSYNRDPKTSEIDKWQRQLTYLQKVMITTAFRDNADLARFGYDFSVDGPLGSTLSGCFGLARKARRSAFVLGRKGQGKLRQGLRLFSTRPTSNA